MARDDERDGTGAPSAAGWGSVAGLVAAVPAGGLLQLRAMLDVGVAGVLAWGLFLLVGAVVGVVVAAGRGGLAVAASGGVMIGLLGWLLVSLTLAPVFAGQAPV